MVWYDFLPNLNSLIRFLYYLIPLAKCRYACVLYSDVKEFERHLLLRGKNLNLNIISSSINYEGPEHGSKFNEINILYLYKHDVIQQFLPAPAPAPSHASAHSVAPYNGAGNLWRRSAQRRPPLIGACSSPVPHTHTPVFAQFTLSVKAQIQLCTESSIDG